MLSHISRDDDENVAGIVEWWLQGEKSEGPGEYPTSMPSYHHECHMKYPELSQGTCAEEPATNCSLYCGTSRVPYKSASFLKMNVLGRICREEMTSDSSQCDGW